VYKTHRMPEMHRSVFSHCVCVVIEKLSAMKGH
jgi:hypothetical protein